MVFNRFIIFNFKLKLAHLFEYITIYQRILLYLAFNKDIFVSDSTISIKTALFILRYLVSFFDFKLVFVVHR